MLNKQSNNQSGILFDQNSRWLTICLVIMFILATLIRLDDIKTPGHLLDREYTSAIFARAYYFADNQAVPEWEREIAVTAKDQQPVLEPPFLDYLVSLVYRIVGREDLSFARYITSAFWLIGGWFMFLIVRKLLSTDEAFVATGYYLFVPMGILISRSFQPDSLMMMMFLISLYVMLLYFDAPSTQRLIAASLLTGITLLLRPLVIFAIFCAFLALSYYRNRNWKKLIDWPFVIFSVFGFLPSVIYYGYGIIFAGFMRWKVTTSFMPYLLVKKDFWLGWLDNVLSVAEFIPLFLAIIGFFLIRNKRVRYLIVGLAIGFMLFSLTFTYHIHTHPYYHIQLFPIVGICLAPAMIRMVDELKQISGKSWWVPIFIGGLLVAQYGYREIRQQLFQYHLEDPAVAREIGELVHHSPHTVYVAYYYGLPLEYYGEFSGAPWPVRIEDEFYRHPGELEQSVQKRIENLGFVPEYFVVTNFDLFNRKHQDLKKYLQEDCTTLAQTEAYLIYSSCQSLTFFHNLPAKSVMLSTN